VAWDNIVWGRQGRGYGWWAVFVWVGLAGLFDAGVTIAIWQENQGSGVFMVAVSMVAWAWVLAGALRRRPEPGGRHRHR